MTSLKKPKALVTGAANGIGKSIVEQLLTNGFFVYAVDVDEKAGAALENSFCNFIKADISNESEVKSVFSKIDEIDLLVNNAGIIRDNLIWNMPVEDFDKVISVNLKGTWLMCKEVAMKMKKQNKGAIVNIASRAWLGNKGQSNYSPSKAGVVSLTRVLALELGKYNIRVNAVAPGLINTPLTQKLEKQVLDNLIAAQPTKTMGEPSDVANAVLFLASDNAKFITGQTIYVDGGKSVGASITL